MIPTLFVSYREIPGFTPGLHRIGGGKVILFTAGLTNDSKQREFREAVPEIRRRITKELHLAGIPRAVAYVGKQQRGPMEALIRELLPRGGTRIVTCGCDLDKKQIFAMNHGLQITFCECDGGGPTMLRLIEETQKL